jgi:hypothetical protein
VVVAPIAVPLPGGKVKVGTAASEPMDEPDHLPVHEDEALRGEKAGTDKADTDKATKLAAAAAAGNHQR